jgi:hypothetical protein
MADAAASLSCDGADGRRAARACADRPADARAAARAGRLRVHACGVGAHENYSFALPSSYSDEHAAPLLCAGLIGFRGLDDLRAGRVVGAAVLHCG